MANILLWKLLPDVGPRGQREQRDAHDEVGKVGERVQADQAEDSAEDVHDDGDRKVDGRRPRRLEDVLAFVVRPERAELFVQVLFELFAVLFRELFAAHLALGGKLKKWKHQRRS